jgi:hypothetical protein
MVMDERNPDEAPDESLKGVLENWTIGSPSDALEARLRETFRKAAGKKPRPWPGWLGASVRVPVPVLVGLVFASLVSAAFAILNRAPVAPPTAERPSPQTTRGPGERSVSLLGFEPVTEPKLTVLGPGARP